jgi:hypothetical protein
MIETGSEGAIPAALHLALKAGLLGAALAGVALALMLEGWQAILAALLAAALIASAFVGLPSLLLAYVRSRRGPSYQRSFSVGVPLLVALVSAYGVWMSIDIALLLDDWSWTRVAAPACYAVGGLLNLGVLVLNIRSLRRGID